MTGHGLTQGYLPLNAQHYYNQVVAFTKELGLRLAFFIIAQVLAVTKVLVYA